MTSVRHVQVFDNKLARTHQSDVMDAIRKTLDRIAAILIVVARLGRRRWTDFESQGACDDVGALKLNPSGTYARCGLSGDQQSGRKHSVDWMKVDGRDWHSTALVFDRQVH